MHILFCPDSFKDALSAENAALAMARGAARAALTFSRSSARWQMVERAALTH